MELQGVENFEGVLERYERCFRRENDDRPVMNITAPKKSNREAPPAPAMLRERWFNFDWRIDCHEVWVSRTDYIAEAFPSYFCNLGPDVFAGFIGSELEYAEGTSWAKYRVKDWAEEPPLKFNPKSFYWMEMEKYVRLAAERGEGRWIVASGDIHPNADALSALRGPENLCFDLIERPDEIKKRLAECFKAYKEAMKRHFDIIHPHSDGVVTSWITVPVRGRYAALQNDFSCMVGPEMYREFFLPWLREEAAFLDHCVYHWDGPNAIPHMDAICGVEGIDAIQWVYGDGNGPMSKWIPLLKKLQERGAGLWVYCGREEVKRIVEALKPQGMIITTGAGSREEAEAIVKEVEGICARK
ncbi:MAG TPA: hypothetical protein PL033_15990 [Candidatus Brocadiia bacterium]|nr:hypothetical protein [Candidatus Brocadiia bacterium]